MSTSFSFRYPSDIGSTPKYPHILKIDVFERVLGGGGISRTDVEGTPIRSSTGAAQGVGRSQSVENRAAVFGSTAAGSAIGNTLAGSGTTDFQQGIRSGVTVAVITAATNLFKDQIYTLKPAGNVMLHIAGPPAEKFTSNWSETSLEGAGVGSTTSGKRSGEGEVAYLKRYFEEQAVAQAQYLTVKNAKNILGDFGSALQVQSGFSLNPFNVLKYNGQNLRTFDLTYKFIPRNQSENIQVRKLLRVFKKFMHGDYSNTQNIITYPGEFKLSYMFYNPTTGQLTPNRSLFGTVNCALTGLDITYGSDKDYVSFADGSPVETTVKFSFKELEQISKTKYDNIDDIGL